tara:strand:- start:2343 stop:3203 length:861 start_codon:yes stop_codon:yes gene_type:complete
MINIYKADNSIGDGITAVLYTLNNESDISDCLTSILNTGYDQLLVVDGESDDNTVPIAEKFEVEIIKSKRGFNFQRKAALAKTKHKYLIGLEADHRYPSEFCLKMRNYLKKTNLISAQAKLKVIGANNYFENGLKAFYEIHQDARNKTDIIGGPSIIYSKFLRDHLMASTFKGGSADTERSEIIKNLGFKVGYAPIYAYQYEKMNLKIFFDKYYWYGKGDHHFYKAFSKQWNFKRRSRSLFHVFNRYIIKYPIRMIKTGNIKYVPYLWFSALIRYYGWLIERIKDW